MTPTSREKALQIIVGVVAVALVVSRTGWLVPAVVAAVILMVVGHEFGHYITARLTGMKVTEFFVGFGPRVWSIRRGETEFGLKALPLGGYVRIVGMSTMEVIEDADEPRSYRAQSYPRRVLVASAGSLMHALMAFVIVVASLSVLGVPDERRVGIGGLLQWDNGAITPAVRAGVRAGDEVIALNGRQLDSVMEFISAVHVAAGKPLTLTLRRGDHTIRRVVTPVDGRTVTMRGAPLSDPAGASAGYLGVELEALYSRMSPWSAMTTSARYVANLTMSAVSSLPQMFAPSQLSSLVRDVTDSSAAQATASTGQRPVSGYGAVRLAVQSAEAGPREFVQIFATLNIFIGVLNLIPILPLDGGLIAVATYERVRSRKGRPRYQADLTKMTPFVYAFLALLAVLFFSTLYLDIVHPIANPFQ